MLLDFALSYSACLRLTEARQLLISLSTSSNRAYPQQSNFVLLNPLFLFLSRQYSFSHLFTRDRPHVKECGGGKACGYLAVERADAAAWQGRLACKRAACMQELGPSFSRLLVS